MAREIVSEQQFRGWMNAQMQRHEECSDCHFGRIMKLQGTDETGCNWSEPVLGCSGQPTGVCLPIAQQVLAQGRAKFNLA
jgi:hypothetical protein